jgi:sugar phosphate isomerase/epimerase
MSGAFLPADMDDFTPELARRVRTLGFSGVFTRFRANDPLGTPDARCRRLRAVLDAEGVCMYQATGYWQTLIHPDESARRDAVRTLRQALKLAAALGARSVDTGPGSVNPAGPWFPHPYNWSAQARGQLVRSLRECAGAAEEHGVFLCLEGHQLVTLECAETMRDVLVEVDSPWVRADFDPVNWITRETVFDTGPAIEQMLATLGDRVVSAHAKDVVIEDRLHLHLGQRPPGKGTLDYRAFLLGMEALDPDAPVIVEDAEADELPEASGFLHGLAAELGIAIRE